jgi:hypothetical protein
MRGKLHAVGLVCSMLVTTSTAYAQFDDYSRRQALATIADYADRICNVVEMSGGSSTSEARAGVNAQLKGLASRLAQIGGSAGGKMAQEQYRNVDRSQLADVLKNNADCKLKTSDRLINIFLQPTPSPSPSTPQPSLAVPNQAPNFPYQPPQTSWKHSGDQRQIADACQQGSSDACLALARSAQVGCQMGNQDKCALANHLASMGYQ